MSVSGTWSGKLIDSSGPTALVQLDLTSRSGRIRGEFRVTFLPPPDVDCGPSAPRTVAVGRVTGTESKSGRVRIRSRMETAGTRVVVDLRVEPGDARPHARKALFGCYEVGAGADVLTMQGGGCVLWQYAGARRRKAG
jgi:hypothetical protein